MSDITSKYRPITFEEVIGQDVTVRILRNSVLMDRIPPAIIIHGLKGTGKTTLARIYSKSVNCEDFRGDPCGKCGSCLSISNHPNIWEMDAASNNGVDDIRALSEIISQRALYKRKVLILDEVHQLSKQAQSAFLKMLEEPPSDSLFILVTTDPSKLERTILSRCMNLKLSPISESGIIRSVEGILRCEGYEYDELAPTIIARNSDGSLRDVQKLLERIFIYSDDKKVTKESLVDSLGVLSRSTYAGLFKTLNIGSLRKFIMDLEEWWEGGMDLELLFSEGLPNLCMDMMVVLSACRDFRLNSWLTFDEIESRIRLNRDEIKKVLLAWEDGMDLLRGGMGIKTVWQTFLIKVCHKE
jgi:DNA polymerase III subunit gamma/tau